MTDFTYRTIIGLGRTWFKLMDFRWQISGAHHIPREGGAVLAINHISYVDFLMAGYGALPSGRLTRFMAKRETFDHKVTGPIMRNCKHISVDRAAGQASYDEAVDYLRRGEVVGVFPEATISRSFLIKELKTGAVRMAADADVPLVPMVLWGTQRLKTKDHPRDFSRNKTISVQIGEPLDPQGATAADKTAAAARGDERDARPGDPRLPRRRAAPRQLVAARPRTAGAPRRPRRRGASTGRSWPQRAAKRRAAEQG